MERGFAYQCGSCDYKGEKRRVLDDLHDQHLTVNEHLCDECDFGTADSTKYRMHPRWYLAHVNRTGSNQMLPPGAPRPESLVAHEMMHARSREESLAF